MNAPARQAPPARPGLFTPPLALTRLREFDTVIDVRSPGEFAEDHLPGAVNLPVLSNAERVEVGTLYKQASAFDAKKVGAALVARNIAAHIDSAMRDKPRSWKPLIYCWRGGSRSGAMTHILRSIGWGALQLEGGYKVWRRQVVDELEKMPATFDFQVICGRTGSGKSRLLDALAASGRQVLDLERLAAHKGSVLGDLPDEAQPSQKMFESLIWAELSQFLPDRPVYVEAESKRVGVLRVPENLMQCMRQSHCHEVRTPSDLRIQLLREEYIHLIAHPDRLFAKLDCLKDLHSGERITAWKSMAQAGRWDEFVADMLEYHYDPAYGKSMYRNYIKSSDASPLELKSIAPGSFAAIAASLPA